MKKPTKRSQLDKRRNRSGLYDLNRSIIAWNSNCKPGVGFILSKRHKNKRPISERLVWAVERIDHHWLMHIVCVAIKPTGGMEFEQYLIDPSTEDNPGPHNYKNLLDAFDEIHEQYMDLIPEGFGKGAMWMASLDEIEYSDEDLEKIWSMRSGS